MGKADIEKKKETQSLADKTTVGALVERTNVINVFNDIKVKDRLEAKAFDALERRLEPRHVMCKPCKGDGYSSSGDACGMCQGQGFVVQDADMRAIELVLSPKFPKTQVNVNADIEGMSADDLLKMVEEM